jgi:L-iditol 2-dehydrogenase
MEKGIFLNSKTIRAAFVDRGQVVLRTVPRPNLEEGSVMVRMKASGICGTDLEKISGGYTASTILGHEVSGVVSESKSPLYEEGEKVIPHHHVACGDCYYCKIGSETMCDGFRNSNFAPCGFADEFKVPKYNVKRNGVHKIKDISFEIAAFAEPLGCCLRGLNRSIRNADFSSLKNVLLVGSGPIGLLHMEILSSKAPDANIIAADISSTRLEFAEKNERATPLDVRKSENFLFSTNALKLVESPGFDLVIVATASQTAFSEAVKCTRKGGTLLLFGAPHRGSSYNLDLQSLLLQERTITSSYATTEKEIEQAIKMLLEKKINTKKFITSSYSLDKIREALSAATSESQVKVVVLE